MTATNVTTELEEIEALIASMEELQIKKDAAAAAQTAAQASGRVDMVAQPRAS